MDPKVVMTVILSIFGTCVTGFFFLVVWMRGITKEIEDIKVTMKDSITYEWFEKIFKPELKQDIHFMQIEAEKDAERIVAQIKELKDAIIGTVTKKGLFTVMHDHDSRLGAIEKILDERKNGK